MIFSLTHLFCAATLWSLTQAQAPPTFCFNDSNCGSVKCQDGNSATCQVDGIGQPLKACLCSNGSGPVQPSSAAAAPLAATTTGPGSKNTPQSSIAAVILPSSVMSQAASATSQLSSASSAAASLMKNPTDASAAQAAKSAVQSALNAANTVKQATQDPATVALLSNIIGPLTTAEQATTTAASAPSAEVASQVANAIAAADTASAALEAAIEKSQEEQPTHCQATKRWDGPGRKLRSRAGTFAFAFNFCGEANPPENEGDIPDSQTCTNKLMEMNTYTKEHILDSVLRGAKYALGKQVYGSQKYPHTFTNTPGIDIVTPEAACLGGTLLEFPILKSGILPAVRNKSTTDVGTERVIFLLDETTHDTTYCGIITHHSPFKIEDKDPFTNC